MLGGFLGAGKTTTIARLARHYQKQGRRIGIVTNDQATDLVDTNSLRAQGFDVGEVPGACFCCNFNKLTETVGQLENIIATGDPVPRLVRGEARMAAAHIVHESRALIGLLLGASGASAHFLDNPLQRIKRDVDVLAGHVVFDYDTSRELAGALILGMDIPRTAMV